MMRHVICFLICLFYIIGPVLNTPLGLYADPILLLSCITFFCVRTYRFQRVMSFFKMLLYILIPFQLYLIFPLIGVFFFPEYGRGISLSDIIRPLRIALTLYGGMSIITLFYHLYGEFFFQKLLKIIVVIMVCNAVIMLCQTFSENFDSTLSSILFRIDDNVNRYGLELRSSGFFLSGGALPSVFQTITSLFIPYLINKKELSYSCGIVLALFLFTTSILTGRSGLLCVIPFIYVLYRFTTQMKFIKIVFIGSCVMLLVIPYVNLFESDALLYSLERLSWLSSESLNDGTVHTIVSKFSIPNNLYILLFGVLNFDNSVYSYVSDMGFDIKLWTYGIIGWIIFYAAFAKIWWYIYKAKCESIAIERILVMVFLATYMLFEFKEDMMYARNGLSILSLVVFGYVLCLTNKSMSTTNEVI